MSLPDPVPRERLHLRRISYEGFRRADGLFDIEAHLIDTKDHPFVLATGVRQPQEPVHDMWVRVTVDSKFQVHDIEAATDAMPYPGHCNRITPAYRQLIGCNLVRGFRKAVSERLGGIQGCTHLSELLAFLPTAAVQTFASLLKETASSGDRKPFQLDACHALATDGDAVRLYYPRWYRAQSSETQANETLGQNAEQSS